MSFVGCQSKSGALLGFFSKETLLWLAISASDVSFGRDLAGFHENGRR